ncbi:hypothetical protein AB0I81_43310 [Nonomuraea sp. NPDC050404]|uniref:hypothetical protein n=1 Tax=Nonomuraea sp. NPDC050404 TaxID=3155783 RepID=UPI0033F6040C
MRVSVAVCVPILFCLAACGPSAPPSAAPSAAASPAPQPTTATATATAEPPASAEPSATVEPPATARTLEPSARESPSRPALAGPKTVCGQVKAADGSLAAVAVHRGRADCKEAVRVLRAYYRPQTAKQGTAGIATVSGWECASNTAAETMRSGRLTSCRKAGTTIVADVIP